MDNFKHWTGNQSVVLANNQFSFNVIYRKDEHDRGETVYRCKTAKAAQELIDLLNLGEGIAKEYNENI